MEYRMLHNIYGGFGEGIRLFDICRTLRTPAGGGHHPLVLATPKSISTQVKYMKDTMTTRTMETQQESTLKNSQTSSYLSEDSLAKLSALLESELDLTTPEGHSFLTSQGFLKKKDHDIWYSKTSKVYLVTTAEGLSRQSLGFSPTWGIALNGRYLTAKTSEFPRTESECSLSDILEENVDEKYFLSPQVTERIMKFGMRVKTPLQVYPTVRTGMSQNQNDQTYVV